MKVVSINVSLPRAVSVHGQEVETGIFKVPVTGPVVVRELNLEGDGQADLSVHGGADKAVYLYPWDNILYWRKALSRDDLGPGSFGENLTVEGLGENDVAIGDEFAIGTARFRVTQPRMPCFKLALALETPEHPQNIFGERAHRLLSSRASGRHHPGRRFHLSASVPRNRACDDCGVCGIVPNEKRYTGTSPKNPEPRGAPCKWEKRVYKQDGRLWVGAKCRESPN